MRAAAADDGDPGPGHPPNGSRRRPGRALDENSQFTGLKGRGRTGEPCPPSSTGSRQPPLKVSDGVTIHRNAQNESKPLPRRIGLCLGALVARLLVLATAVPTATGRGRLRVGPSSPVPTPPSPSSDLLMGTTCTGAWNCWAVGRSLLPAGQQLTAARHGRPLERVDLVGGTRRHPSRLARVPPVERGLCHLVGLLGGRAPRSWPSQKSPVPLAEHWNGSAWSVVPTPDISGYLFSVTCTGASNCWAVGHRPRRQQEPPGRRHPPLGRIAVVRGSTGTDGSAL